jgi:hypothetical protein
MLVICYLSRVQYDSSIGRMRTLLILLPRNIQFIAPIACSFAKAQPESCTMHLNTSETIDSVGECAGARGVCLGKKLVI